jgi:uncharacterized protein (TIGR00369 family)
VAERTHIIGELGLETDLAGDALRGKAAVTPNLWVPGTQVLRTSVLLTWADVVAGVLSALTITPRIAVTLDLEVHVIRQTVGTGEVTAEATVLKAGRTVVVAETRFTDGDGALFATSHGTFVASPDPAHVQPEGFLLARNQSRQLLQEPLAERVGLRRLAPGRVEMPRHEEGLNPIGAIQGGLVALAAEEAAVSVQPGTVLNHLEVRYLRPFMVGPAVAVAEVDEGVARVRLTDEGSGAKLGAVATGRLSPAAG